MTTTKKKQTRKSVSMPGYVYDAFSVACEAAGVPMAAQNERLVRDWLATQTGEVPVAPDKPARKEKPAKAPRPVKPPKEPKAPKKKAPRKKGKATEAVGAADPLVAAAEAIGVHAEIQTETGVVHVCPDGTEIEHIDEPTAEMEDSAEEALAALAEPEVEPEPTPTEEPEEEEYVDDREIVVDDEFIDDGEGVAF